MSVPGTTLEGGSAIKQTMMFGKMVARSEASTTRKTLCAVILLAYRTGEAWNETAYANPEFDAKLEKALAAPDPKDRKVIMKDLEQILQDSGIIVQPYWITLSNHRVPAVKNFGMHPLYEVYFEDTWIEA